MIDGENVIKAIDICIGHGKCDDCGYRIKGGYSTMDCRKPMMRDALSLLKKYDTQVQYRDDHIEEYEKEIKRLNKLVKEQEAVTIKKTKEHGFGVYGGICPKCRNWIQSAHSFCGFCGQAVKWE